METLYQYLNRMGLLDREAIVAELTMAKREHRKIYQKSYQKEYRKKNIRKDSYYTQLEHLRLSTVAKKYKMSVPRLCKVLAFAYLDGYYVLADDKQVHQLELYLRGVTNNINQLTRYIHQRKGLSFNDILTFREQINEMEDHISTSLRHPVNLQEYLENQIQQTPEIISVLQHIIEPHKHQ